MKAQDLIDILSEYPEAEVTIVDGEDTDFAIEKDKIYFNEDSTGEMFIDIDISLNPSHLEEMIVTPKPCSSVIQDIMDMIREENR